MRIAVVHEAAHPPTSSIEILYAIKDKGAEALYLRPSRISCSIVNGDVKFFYGMKELPLVDAIIVRSLGFITSLEQFVKRYALIKLFELKGTLIVNPIDSMVICRDKFLSLSILAMKGIPVPETLITEVVPLAMTQSKKFSTFVLKPVVGSLGLGSLKLDDTDILFNIAKLYTMLNQPLYIQRYVRKPGRDIRVLVIGDKIVGAIYRVAPSSDAWKTNIAQGARPEPAKLDSELEELSFKVVEALKLYYAGIDIVEDLEDDRYRYKVIEVNASPLWSGLKRALGVNPAKELIEYIFKLVKR